MTHEVNEVCFEVKQMMRVKNEVHRFDRSIILSAINKNYILSATFTDICQKVRPNYFNTCEV